MLTASSISSLTCLLRYSSHKTLRPIVTGITQLRYRSAESEPVRLPTPDEEPKVYSGKIQAIVSEISKLTLLEVADLNELLKKTLNISDAPVMAMGAMPMGASQSQQESEEGDEAAITQTNFTLRINKFDESKKVPLIKYIKTVMEGMNLVQAKKFVESLPAVVRKDAPKDEVEKLQEELTAIGAESIIE